MGWGVSHEDSYAHTLEKELGIKVLNAAVPSYGTARELILLKRVDRSKLRTLVLQFCDNDLDENIAYITNHGVLKVMDKDKYLQLQAQHEQNQRYYPGKMLFNMTLIFRELWRILPTEPSRQETHDKVSTLVNVLKNPPIPLDGIQLILFELNARNKNDSYFITALKEEIAATPAPQYLKNIKLIDTTKILSEDDYYWYDDHLRASGHAKMARSIKNEIVN